ncbi:MAG: 30S ribosomal protein S6 [Bacilli bacterium]|nr:30S ribosomal protein S6 [bacterium]MDY3757614.1 30S ribosomal protein S6 [Bacilli bacterium]
MDKYEIMFIVKTTLEESVVKSTVESLTSIITDMKGKVENSKDMGQRELAYPIKKEISGFYYVLTVEASHEAIAEFDRKARLNENILRHQIIKLDEE